jgi:hypothetical protein
MTGDFNNDAMVDAADYVVCRKQNGSPGGYSEWQSNFGRTGIGSSFGAAAPEPVTGALLFIVAIVAAPFRGTRL